MKTSLWLLVVAVSLVACGGKVQPGPTDGAEGPDGNEAPASAPAAEPSTGTSGSGSNTATTTSAAPPDPTAAMSLDEVCQAFADRNAACGAEWDGYKDTCLGDCNRLDCGKAAEADYRCVVAHPTCGAVDACKATYCAYLRCNSNPDVDIPECH